MFKRMFWNINLVNIILYTPLRIGFIIVTATKI